MTFDPNGGSFAASADYTVENGKIQITTNSDFKLGQSIPEVTRRGYKLTGWFRETGNGQIDQNTLFTENTTVKAVWEVDTDADKKFVITFDPAGGILSGNGTLTTNTSGTLAGQTLPRATRSNHKFNDWYYNGSVVTTGTVFTSDAVVYAMWTGTGTSGGGGGGSSSGGGGGGGSSSGSATYPPTVTDPEHGSVTVTPQRPGKGETVVIRPIPDEGYKVDDVVVTKPDGSKVPVKDNGDGSWSFVQPNAKVTVSVTFKPASATDGVAYDQCSGGSGCPIWPFTDASTTAWYHDGVHYCLENGMMLGKNSTIFAPNGTVTRGQIVAILWRLDGKPMAGTDSYSDVPAGQYYAQAVAWASANGVVTGYSDGTFRPDMPITREQMAAILWRYAKYKSVNVSGQADLSRFTDRGQVASYAAQAMAWANANGLINGMTATTLVPRGDATRAQAASILQRFCENILKR